MFDLRISPTTQRDLRETARKLRRHGDRKAIRRELVNGLKDAVRPVEAQVKRAARSLPAKGPRSTGLREQIARATSTQVRTGGRTPGVSLRVSRARMRDRAAVARGLNRGQWRHPVFGRDVWVTQESPRPDWFDNIARASRGRVRRRVGRVLDDIERKLGD